MNISKKLPPIPTKNGKKIYYPVEHALNHDNSLFKVLPKPLSRQSLQIIENENEEIQPKRERKMSIEKLIPRCRSSKIFSDSRSVSSERSVSKVPKQAISGKQIASLPYITAKSWVIFQINTNKLIYGKKQDMRRQVASLTKISNLITILQILTQHNLDCKRIMVTITKEAVSMIGTTAVIKEGMVLTLNDLLYGMMLPSGNDAAYQIALVGGAIINSSRQNLKLQSIVYDRQLLANSVQKYGNNIIVYLNKMNTIAKLKAKTMRTSFANPHGLSNVHSLSTAEDMARLSAYAMKNQKFREVVQTKFYSCKFTKLQLKGLVNDQNSNPNISSTQAPQQQANKMQGQLSWQNTNKMLWRGFSGIKTGITPNAGPCLSASVKKFLDGKEYELVIILLKSYSMQTRWKEVQGLAQWATQLIKK